MTAADTPLRRALPRVLLATLVLGLCTLPVGFLMDDNIQAAMLEGLPKLWSPWDLYRFVDGDPERTAAAVAVGPLPWWTSPGLLLSFWRPLSTLLANIDHALFGVHAVAWHAHSALWYVALVAAYGLLLRRVLPGSAGVFALWAFALTPTHFVPAAWIANRNATVAAVFALLGLLAHLRWRAENWRPGLPLSLAALAAGLAGGETALGMLGYWLAYEAFGRDDSSRRRFASLLPAGLLALGYLVLHHSLGYGARDSAVYLDPRNDALSWLAQAPARTLALIGGQLLATPLDLWAFGPAARPWLVAAGAAGMALYAWLLRACAPLLEDDERRALRWMLPGALLSLAPVLSTFPLARLLLVPGVGAYVLVGVLVAGLRRRRDGLRPALPARWAGTLLAVIALGAAPVIWIASCAVTARSNEEMRRAALNAEIDDNTVASQRVVVVAAPDPGAGFYPFHVRFIHGRPLPARITLLSLAPKDVVARRTGPSSLQLRPAEGALLESLFEELFLSPARVFRVGERFDIGGVVIGIEEVRGTRPSVIEAVFDRPLEDPSLLFLSWHDGRLRRVKLPPPGGEFAVAFEPTTLGMQ